MDKQKQYSARPQGFRGSSRPAPAKAQEETPEKKPVAKKAAPKKRAKRRVQRRESVNIRKRAIFITAALLAALIAFFVVRGVIIIRNKTVHMLPEIYDIETPAPTASPVLSGEGAPEALDNFIAEGGV